MHPRLALPLVVATAAVGLGLVVPAAAPAGCVAPTLAVPGAPASTTSPPADQPPGVELQVGDAVTVTGEWYFVGCNDTGSSSGCSRPSSPPPEQPARDVRLEITQGSRTWTLGTTDAAGPKRHYRVRWQITLPSDLKPGPAILTAHDRTTLPVIMKDRQR